MQSLIPQPPVGQIFFPKAPCFRRAAAELIDRLVPLPFLAHFFWPWAFVAFGYDLLADTEGASVGKRLLGLEVRVVSTRQYGQQCSLVRSLLRNLPWCLARLCYTSVAFIPLGIAYDLIELVLALASPTGRRLGDMLAGTQVTALERTRA